MMRIRDNKSRLHIIDEIFEETAEVQFAKLQQIKLKNFQLKRIG